MSNTVTNILTINGTEEQVAEVRNFIKGSRGKSISLQSIYPMPKKLKGKREVEVKGVQLLPAVESFSIPDWMVWRMKWWGTKGDAEPIMDDEVNATNRIIFNTPSTTPLMAMAILSAMFPEVTLQVIFCDQNEDSYCGEYTLSGGKAVNMVWYDVWAPTHDDIPIDQVMEYYFLTHEYDRAMWKKDDDGCWYRINGEGQDEE